MKKALIAMVVIGAAALSFDFPDVLAQPVMVQARQIRLTDGILMSWGTVTTGSAGGAAVTFGSAYKNPPTVIVTPNFGTTPPTGGAASYAAVAYGITVSRFAVRGEKPGTTYSFIAVGP